MFDLLLILFTIALLFIGHLLRVILAIRIPYEMHLKPVALKRPPDIMSDLFEEADRELTGLGFTGGHWISVQSTPKLPGFTPPLARLYHHPGRPIVARVTPPFNISAVDRCQVVFLSISQEKTFVR